MDEKPSYYAIIPANVRYDNRLKAQEKLMYGEITVLANKYGYCTAGNAYFAELYEKSNETISRWITNLINFGYVSKDVIRDDNQRVIQRKIYLDNTLLSKMTPPSPQKREEPPIKNVKENNTRVNNTSNNSSSSKITETSENPYELYQQITGRNLTGVQQPKMMDFIKTDGVELVVSALKTAQYIAKQSDSKASYGLFDSVIHEWEDKGIKTIEQAREYEKQRLRDKKERMNKSKQAYYGHPTIDRKIPESFKEEYDPEKDRLSPEQKAETEKILAEFEKGRD